MARPHSDDADRDALPLAPLCWAIGYSGLHITVLLRAVMAWQQPALLVSASFWLVNLALATGCVALMTSGWGARPRR
ncbi:MAG: hypothetical protein LPJ91_04870 [Pseudazoarcus pumilus]|nr:hypothetical protein [Pseudazoarcus pumilus]